MLADGRLRWVLTTKKMPLRDRHGQIISTFGISKDLTEFRLMEQMLEQERNLLRAVIDALPEHIYVKDRKGRFVLANNAVAHFFGLVRPNELVGKSDFDFFSPELAVRFQEEEQRFVRGVAPVIQREARFAAKDGRIHRVITTKLPLRDRFGTIIGVARINRDISQRKWDEEQLRQLNAESSRNQKELLEADQDLKRTNEELKQAQAKLIQAEKLECMGAASPPALRTRLRTRCRLC